MKPKFKPNTFVTDEQLFFRGQQGDQTAISILYNRYYHQRSTLGMLASPDTYPLLDEADAFDAFEEAFLRVLSRYERRRSSFRTFFMACFTTSIADLHRKNKSEMLLLHAANLEDIVAEKHGEPLYLHDIIPSGEIKDDPRAFFEYAEVMEELQKLPKEITPLALKAAKLVIIEGYTVSDAVRLLKVKRTRLSYLIHMYQEWARKVLHRRAKENENPWDYQGCSD